MSRTIRTLPALYKDNSMNKESIRQKITEKKTASLEKKLEKTLNHRRFLSQLIEKEDKKAELLDKIQSEITQKKALIEKMNQAASKIQKKRKELKVIRQSEDIENTEIEAKIQENLQSLHKVTEFIFWNLGFAPEYAATYIKRAYKRSKFRQKIKRIKKIYKIIAKNKKALSKHNLRKFIRVFSAKERIRQAVQAKEDLLREAQLKLIRANLALITIKLFWKTSKLSHRRLIFRIRKYKKMNKHRLNFLSSGGLKSEFSSYLSTPNPETVNQAALKELEIARQAAEKLAKDRENQLNHSFISYSIKKYQPKRIIPLDLLSKTSTPKSNTRRVDFSVKTISYSNQAGKSTKSISNYSARSTSHQARNLRMLSNIIN